MDCVDQISLISQISNFEGLVDTVGFELLIRKADNVPNNAGRGSGNEFDFLA